MSESLAMKITAVAAPVRQQVAAALRAAIIEGQFAPGERLVERELCALTGASRTSVREALRQLESEGLVEIVANKGPIVAAMSATQAKAIYEVREALESFAGELFVQRASDGEVAALRKAVDKVESAYASRDLVRILSAKDQFYKVLLDGCGNECIGAILRTMNARISMLRRVSLDSASRAQYSLGELRAIVDAIEQRDGAKAAATCRRHVQQAGRAALGRLAS